MHKSGTHALLIDDDSLMRQVLARLLRKEGFEQIDEVGDGEQALEALRTTRPDVIITDYEMPRLDGIEFVRALRSRGDSTPVIMLSGHGDPHLIVTAVRAGVDNYVLKPLNPEAFFEKIRQTLGSARAQS